MKITWYGHSCFSLECEGGILVFDPYKDGSVNGLKKLSLKANEVLCSHAHDDHNAIENVELLDKKDFTIYRLASWHDDQSGALRGNNTIHIVECEGMSVVHLGDLGCAVEVSKIKDCDVLMIPIGGYYTIDATAALELIDQINPRIVLPMHYRTETFGYDVLDTLDDFKRHCTHLKSYSSNEIIIDQSTEKQTAILKYIS